MEKDNEIRSDERRIYSVSEITAQIKILLESDFSSIVVSGEISNLRKAASGHVYFTIKDEQAVLSAVIFKFSLPRIKTSLEDGVKAIFTGKISLYAQRGQYQLIVSSAEETGQGRLHIAFEKLKLKLYEEGLFEPQKKMPLPIHPSRVGVITSPSAAAFQDILRVSRKRFPSIDIILYPTQVQGNSAAGEITAAIQQAEKDKLVDVLIISRGGGSIEDLWPFNEESVARALAACQIPVVSGIGHEIDFTICDYIADRRGATPSSAAEIVFPDRQSRRNEIQSFSKRYDYYLEKKLRKARTQLEAVSANNLLKKTTGMMERSTMQLDDVSERIISRMKLIVSRFRQHLAGVSGKVSALDPTAPFRKGFSVVRSKNSGELITNAAKLTEQQDIDIEFNTGSAAAVVTSINKGRKKS